MKLTIGTLSLETDCFDCQGDTLYFTYLYLTEDELIYLAAPEIRNVTFLNQKRVCEVKRIDVVGQDVKHVTNLVLKIHRVYS